MEDKTSIIKWMGLPEPFAIVLLILSLIFALAPYLPGKDFGVLKIPQFTPSTRKILKIIGPIVFLTSVMLFVPLIAQSTPPPKDVHDQVQLHIKHANDLFENRLYEDAIKQCDEALKLDPKNEEAYDLKKRLLKTVEILKRP